jgi:hypothetical protein
MGAREWSLPKRIPIDDGVLMVDALASGDLNGDKRTDLVLLGEKCIYFFAQKEDRSLAEPEKIPYSGVVKSMQVLDIDGDGRDDLLMVTWEGVSPFRFRLQNASGQLGPEIHFSMPPSRSYLAGDINGDQKTEIITVAQSSGRAQLSRFVTKKAEDLSGDLKLGQLHVLPLNKTEKPKRGTVWSDLNGDGRSDLVIAEPDSGLLTVFLQQSDGTLASSKSYPTLTGISDLAAADWDGDGKTEVFVLSADERQVGVVSMDAAGHIPFPKILNSEGRPLALAAGKLHPDKNPVLILILEQDGKRILQIRNASGEKRDLALNASFKSNPSGIIVHDVDADGLPDILVLIPYEKMKILRQTASREFEEIDIAPPGGLPDQPWVSVADVDGDGHDELLLPRNNFLRAVVLQSDVVKSDVKNDTAGKTNWTFLVKEQINGASSRSRIVGATALSVGKKFPSLFLFDAERKALSFCEKDGSGVWQILRNIPMPVTEFTGLGSIALKSDKPNAVSFTGMNSIAWMALQGSTWEMEEMSHYETPIKDGYLNDIVMGDLNQDKQSDLVFLETAKNYIDILSARPGGEMSPAIRWQVFEERTFRSRRNDMPEPREALVAEMTGDKKNDLIILVHDRILLYPQE